MRATGSCSAQSQPFIQREVYLDYAAATPMIDTVIHAMEPYWARAFYNPSAPYEPARTVHADLEQARSTLAHLIGARPDCITITAGATEANNLACASVSETGHIVSDSLEHESVLACVEAHPHTLVGVGQDGRIDPQTVASALTAHTELVSVELANGEIGTIQPIREIAAVVRAERERRLKENNKRQLWFHVDASQAAGTLSVNVSSLNCDMLTLSAAKVYGPKQVGLLWAKEGVVLRPLVYGGGQEGGLRSGTENVAGVVGFAYALTQACASRKREAERLNKLRNDLQARIEREFADVVVSGPHKARQRLPHLLHISFRGLDARRLVILLEQRGVYVGTGSACAASKMQTSHVLQAIGMPDELARGSLRITLGLPTTEDDIAYAATQIIDVAQQEYKRLEAHK